MLEVYLAGSILGCNENEAKGWRQQLINSNLKGIQWLDPAKGLPALAKHQTYGMIEEPYEVHGAEAYVMRDLYQVRHCDLMVFKWDENRKQVGGLIEFGFALALNIPIVTLVENFVDYNTEAKMIHPFISRNSLVAGNITQVISALNSYT